MIKIILTALVFTIGSFFLIASSSSCATQETSENETASTPPTERTPDKNIWKKTVAKEFLTISELKKKKPADGIYETEGYVVDSYKCVCPPDRLCKCPVDSITISEKDKFISQNSNLSDREIKVATASPEDFKKGQKYRFKVESHFEKNQSEEFKMVYLVAYQ
jgi:hypothetical protein